MYHSDDYYREVIFNEWFSKDEKEYKTMCDGKFFDINIKIKYAPFINTFTKIFRANVMNYDTRQDCYADCMTLVWEGLLKFKIRDDSTWKAIAEKKDMDNYRKLVSYLKTHVTQNIKKVALDYSKTCKSVGKGKDKKILHIFYNVSTESLNKIITFDNSLEQLELVENTTNSYWDKTLKYRYDIFSEWAKENLDKYTTNSQKELLKKLQEVNFSMYDNDYDREELGMARGQAKLKLERICNKITDRYCEERKYFTGGYVVQDIDAEIKAYQKYINILNDENIDNLDERLTKTILSSLNNPHWSNLIYDHISYEAQLNVIEAYNNDTLIYEDNFKLYNNSTNINKKALYEITNAIYGRIEYLQKMRNFEMELLEKEANKKNVKINSMQFNIPKDGNIVYMNVTPNGLMLEKHLS